ncbi:MAG: hypothetical protein MZV64_06975 [Ignavibacteriales bacterium]|nr:hypothetical protein [Ignavibacteriales bacterium]
MVSLLKQIYTYGESAERFSEDEWIFNYGVLVDADLKPDYSVPLGFDFHILEAKEERIQQVFLVILTIFYFKLIIPARGDLDLGLVFNYQWYEDTSIDQTINFTNIYLDVKYYF